MFRANLTRRIAIGLGIVTCSSTVTSAQTTQNYTLNLPEGFSLIANQLDNGSNTLNEIFTNAPDGCAIYKYVNSNDVWLAAYFDKAAGAWLPRAFTLAPGEGAFMESPTAFTAVISGLPHVAGTTSVPNGKCYLVSRQTNAPATYQQIVGKSPISGSQIFQWAGTSYAVSTYDADYGSWDAELFIRTGVSVWVAPSGGLPAPFPTNFFGPVLAATRNGSNVEIEWRGGGMLQQSPDFTNWTDLPGAVSPYPVSDPSATAKYFRVRR